MPVTLSSITIQCNLFPAKNLKLTIDYELQKELEAFTDKHLAFLRSSGIAPGARAAAVVAIDPRNGAVRAMVSRPAMTPTGLCMAFPQRIGILLITIPITR